MQHEFSILVPDPVLERAVEGHQQPHCGEAIFLSPLRGFSPGDEMELPRSHPEGAKRVGESMGNSADPHPTNRLVLSEAEGRVEWIPPLARLARSVGMTRWGPRFSVGRDDVG